MPNTPRWEGDWLFTALRSSTDSIRDIAKDFNDQIHETFRAFILPNSVSWYLGYQNEFMSTFLYRVLTFRNVLLNLYAMMPTYGTRYHCSKMQAIVSAQ